MFQDQCLVLTRVPAPAGLKSPETMLLSGSPAARGVRPASRIKYEARLRVHASAFSEILRRVPGRMIWTNPSIRSF